MKFVWMSIAVLIVFLLAGMAPARADSVEYQVTIYAYWEQSAFQFPFGPNGSNVVDQFYATYDMYSNGTVVPGTMSFNIVDSGGPLGGGTPFTYGVVPSFCDSGTGLSPVGEGCNIPASFPQNNGAYRGGNTAWYDSDGYLIEAGATPGQLGTTTGPVAIIDCVFQACGTLPHCYDIGCTAGGNNPSSGGYITETLVSGVTKTPEPSALLLICCGALFVVLRRSYLMRKRQQARAFAYGSLRT